MTPFEARAREIAAEYEYDTERLQFQHDRRCFGSFTRTLAGSNEQRDLFARALALAQHRASTPRVQHQVTIELSAPRDQTDTTIIAEAFAELKRTLEAHGYEPNINYASSAPTEQTR